MGQAEQQFFQVCEMYNDKENNNFRGTLLVEAFKKVIFDEELIGSYVTYKEKFDCVYAFLVTRTRILEVSVYSSMSITQTKIFKEIKKVYIEKSFDNIQAGNVIGEKELPERVQVKLSFVDHSNQVEDIFFENIEKKEYIGQILELAKMISKLQIGK